MSSPLIVDRRLRAPARELRHARGPPHTWRRRAQAAPRRRPAQTSSLCMTISAGAPLPERSLEYMYLMSKSYVLLPKPQNPIGQLKLNGQSGKHLRRNRNRRHGF